jgi:hypothetical protein
MDGQKKGTKVPSSVESSLDLGHGRPTFSDSVAAEVDAAGAGVHGGEEARRGVGGEGEPHECRCGLGFVTALLFVVGAVGYAVGFYVVLVRRG